ncbi:Gfo/Idh/MocA family protein [Vallicoccus soli]|uniref:Gfo/Idh/MocA family protein n=1 Tax=Vallicoccus soli TaxID=2339232 RepID=UPI001C499231|nr:Gfo/Idh/MocA family oxidoreductase [Vallicoccus soli]
MDGLRAGLVGAGGVGARHAQVLAGLEGVSLVAVTDTDAGRARALADEHGATAYPDLDALLAAPGLDAVWLCLPPFAHGDAERAVVAAGLPFLVEKPLAADLATAEAVAAEVAAAGLVTATGYHWRGMPGVERAREALDGTPVRLAHGAWLDKVPPVAWWPRRDLSGGQLVEQATHLLDVLRLLAGEPVRVSAHAAALPDRDPALVDAATAATLVLDGGAVATLVATSLLDRKHAASLTLVGERTLVEVGELETRLEVDGRSERVPDDGVSKQRVDAEFCAAVRTGDPSLVRVPYAEALRTHRVGWALAESARTGAPVEVPR